MRKITLLLLLALGVLRAQTAHRYIFVGTYETGEVLAALCLDTGCKLGLSGDVVKLPITLAVQTSKASVLLSAVRASLRSAGYYLSGTPTGQISITADAQKEMYAFVDCKNHVSIVPKEYASIYLKADSLQCLPPEVAEPLASRSYVFQYFSFDNTVLDNWGVDWSKVLSSGDFFSKPEIPLSWSIRALGENDSLLQFRMLEFSLDSAVRIVWGNESQNATRTYTESGIITTSYEWRDYGLIVDVKRYDGKMTLTYSFVSDDQHHNKLSGLASSPDNDTLLVVGAYQDFDKKEYFVPFLGKLPVIGELFTYREEKSVYRFFVLRLIPKSG